MTAQHAALTDVLAANITWHAARLNFLALFLLALLKVKTVNLSELAVGFESDAQTASSYKRLQRFLRGFEFDYDHWANLLAALTQAPGPWILSLDRTNWQLGQQNLNLLVLAVVWGEVRVPLFWTALEKRGNSNTHERIELLQRFLRVFGEARLKFLCGDREFVGKRWFQWLQGKGIDFRLRLKENTQVATRRGLQPVKRLFQSQEVGAGRSLGGARAVWGLALHLSGMRLATGEYVIIASPQECPAALLDYRERWGVECLFGCLKSRGFRLEETHVTAPERLSKLLALLALAVVWALRAGQWLREQGRKLSVKKHGRLAQSLFRCGLEWLRKVFLHLHNPRHQEQFTLLLQFLSCT